MITKRPNEIALIECVESTRQLLPLRERVLAEAFRTALLAIVDALEVWLHIAPRTAEIRRMWRKRHNGDANG